MIGLDADVVVRYLTQDDPIQSPRATKLIEGLSEANPGFISVVAMVETAWVLKRSYGFQDRRIAAAIEGLLSADALIAALGAKAGCSVTVTFDKKAARSPRFAPA